MWALAPTGCASTRSRGATRWATRASSASPHRALIRACQARAVIRRGLIGLVVAAGVGLTLVPGGGGGAASAPATAPPGGYPHPSRVAVVGLQDPGYRPGIWGPEAPLPEP